MAHAAVHLDGCQAAAISEAACPGLAATALTAIVRSATITAAAATGAIVASAFSAWMDITAGHTTPTGGVPQPSDGWQTCEEQRLAVSKTGRSRKGVAQPLALLAVRRQTWQLRRPCIVRC